jgi:hypothetical protein
MHLKTLFVLTLIISSVALYAQEQGDVLSRKVTLNFRNTSIEEILKSIETEDFAFTYSAEVFDVKKRVSINVKEESIAAVLEKLFRGQNMECQQMGNKLLIRKKRSARVIQENSDSLKTLKHNAPSTPAPSNNSSAKQADIIPTDQNTIDKKGTIDMSNSSALPVLVNAETSQIPSKEEELLQYYVRERIRTTAFIAKYATYQKRPLIFVPIYPPQPKRLKPIPQRFNLVIEEEPKVEKEKKVKDPDRDKKFRMYISTNVGYTAINEQDAILIGGDIVYNPNRTFGIGLSGKGFISRRELDTELNDTFGYSGGYGGMLLEATLFPKSVFHVTTSVMFGAGEIVYGRLDTVSSTITDIEDQKVLFVLEPTVNFEMNVIKYVRFGFGLSYRDTSNASLKYQVSENMIIGAKDFEGFNFNAFLKFGIF